MIVLRWIFSLLIICGVISGCDPSNGPTNKDKKTSITIEAVAVSPNSVTCRVKVVSAQTPNFVGVHYETPEGKDAMDVYLEDGEELITIKRLAYRQKYVMYAFADIAGHDDFVKSATIEATPGNLVELETVETDSVHFICRLVINTTNTVYLRGITFKEKTSKENPKTIYLEDGVDTCQFNNLKKNTSYVVNGFADIEGFDEIQYSGELVVFTNSVQIDDNDDWKLVFCDEFDGEGAPSNYWSYEEGEYIRNNEPQFYSKSRENSYVSGGYLHIVARKNHMGSDGKTHNYTSASMTTSRSFVWCYGKMEVRAKIPTGGGMWPAIWMVGNGYNWPNGGELDIMEYYREKILANAAWGSSKAWTAVWDGASKPMAYFTGQDPQWREKFHTWNMEWDENYIRIFLDGELMNEIDLSRTYNQGCQGNYENPFKYHKDGWGHYIWLNLALGGNNGGAIDDSLLPAEYLVDYVRVYQQTRLPK